MTLIKLNDNLGTVVNMKYIEYINTEYIKGSNPYYVINIGFVSGKLNHLRYEITNRDIYEDDIKYINRFISRR